MQLVKTEPSYQIRKVFMKKHYLLWLAGLSMLYTACKTSEPTVAADPSAAEPVLFTVQNDPTSLQEFLYVYNKNNFARDSVNPREDMRQYLDLYINFKLKVQEAKEAGLHREEAFIEELAGYKKQLAKPYLSEKKVSEKLVQQAYERLGTEVKASHILVGLKQNPEPADTLAAYNKIMKFREQLLQGEDFEALARRSSEDPSASMNGGNLGYFTALQMVYPFENAAYQTPEGEISTPVRTNFGYHLVKVHDKRPSQGKVKVAHIMVRSDEEAPVEEARAAKEKIDEIYKRLQTGADWEQLASQFSEDRATRNTGGELEWFGTGNMVPSFEEAAFALKEKGSYSRPVQTPYGWHILRLLERQQLPPFEEMQEELAHKVSRDSRAQLQEEALLERLLEENRLREQTSHIEALLEQADSSLLNGRWNYQPDSLAANKALFTINDEPYTTGDFISWLQEHNQPAYGLSPSRQLSRLYQNWQKESLLEYEEAHLEEKYDDYRMLVQEYHDGILLFQLMDEKVWTKALEDTTGLEQFFQANRTDYQWGERVAGTLFSAANLATLQQVEEVLPTGPFVLSEAKLPLAAEQETLSGTTAQVLNKLAATLRQDTSTTLQVLLPEESKALQQPIQNHLQALGVNEEQYELRLVPGAEALVRVLTSSPKAIEREFNKKSPLSLQVVEGPFERGDNPVVDAATWKKGKQQLNRDGRSYLLIIDEVLPAGPKALGEVRGQVISDYQEYLEKEWILTLREKYSIQLNEELLEQTLNKLNEEL